MQKPLWKVGSSASQIILLHHELSQQVKKKFYGSFPNDLQLC